MPRLTCALVLTFTLATAIPARAQSAGVANDGLSSNTLVLHLLVDLLAGMVVIGHATMYGNMVLSDASATTTLESGMGAWPTVTLTAVAGSAAVAAGAIGLAGGDDDVRTIAIVSTTIGSLALACAGLDLTLTLLDEQPTAVTPIAFVDGERVLAGFAGRF